MIQTFIFFDLETTGLIQRNLMPKITELSLIAVSRNAICSSKKALPRVLHKLILPVHPQINIPQKVQSITYLSNENLATVPHFGCGTYDLINQFLKRHPVPICFVAHNGNAFDYPIFLSELKNINKGLDKGILSIDTLFMFKDFFSGGGYFKDAGQMHNVTHDTSDLNDVKVLMNDGYDEILSKALDSVMESSFDSSNKSQPSVSSSDKPKHIFKTSSDPSDSVVHTSETDCCKTMQEINEKTPESQIIRLSNSKTNYQHKSKGARRKLNFTTPQPPNFKLSSIYKHLLGTTPEYMHSAEGDCLAMIRCVSQLGCCFAEWADCNAKSILDFGSR